MTEPCELTAIEARARIGRKQLSPVELLESCIDRIETVDHAVNAMVARDYAGARAAAKAAEAAVMRGDELGALHGLPVGIKDLTPTKGLRTTWGSTIFKDHVPDVDGGFVRRIRAAGGIILGKTNTPEWGAGANTRNAVYGATGNPFDPVKSAAGSSGGSAVALACDMVPIASGSDMGGSLRNPAGFCGIVGFRPTPGAVPSETRAFGWSGLGVEGPMGRDVPDTCLLMSVMASDDAGDPLATTIFGKRVREPGDFHPPAQVDLASLRVAFTPDFGFTPTEKALRKVFADKTALFRHLFRSSADATPDCTGSNEAFEVLRAVGYLTMQLERYRNKPDSIGPNIRANVEEGLRYSAADVAHAQELQTQLYRRWQAFFRDHDILIAPTITLSPRPWRELYPSEIDGVPTRTYFHWLSLAYAVTLPGHPSVSIPLGVDHAGMPFGIQVIGPRGGDAYALAVAAELEAALAGDPRTARPKPDIAKLKTAGPISAMPEFMGFA